MVRKVDQNGLLERQAGKNTEFGANRCLGMTSGDYNKMVIKGSILALYAYSIGTKIKLNSHNNFIAT